MFYRFVLRLLNWVIPERLFSRIVGVIARRRWPAFILQPFLRWYCKRFDVNMSESKLELSEFKTFIEFFTRHLKDGLRPIDPDPNTVTSPVDGKVYSCGPIDKDTILQAKGVSYTLTQMLDDPQIAERFIDGSFIIIYLSPRDYHRIHTPLPGTIDGFRYIPGKLLPVNPPSVAMFPKLFVENERLASFLQHDKIGTVAIIKVGATIVGRTVLSYIKYHTNRWLTPKSIHQPLEQPVTLQKGDEVGMFELGSTVVLLFQTGVTLDPHLKPHDVLQLGQKIASIHP